MTKFQPAKNQKDITYITYEYEIFRNHQNEYIHRIRCKNIKKAFAHIKINKLKK